MCRLLYNSLKKYDEEEEEPVVKKKHQIRPVGPGYQILKHIIRPLARGAGPPPILMAVFAGTSATLAPYTANAVAWGEALHIVVPVSMAAANSAHR